MAWTNAERDALLGTDRDFLEQYCAAVTKARLGAVPPAAARCVIWRLTEILPLAAHATPELWTPDKEPQPLVAIGRLSAALSILGPKVVLFAVGAHLYLATVLETVAEFAQQGRRGDFVDLWGDFRSSNDHRLYRFRDPLNCQPGVDLPPGHPLAAGHPLREFLEWMAGLHRAQPWMISPQAQPVLAQGAPADGRDVGSGCVYPGLVERIRGRPVR